MTVRNERLERARSRVEDEPFPLRGERLADLCRSRAVEDRLLALLLMRRQVEREGPCDDHLERARRLVADGNETCRWQALGVVGRYAEACPDAVWEILAKHGSSDDAGVRSAVATGLLEHLLERHYDTYFPLLKKRVEDGDANLTDTLRRCWLFGGAKRHSREVDRLLGSSRARG